MSGARVLVTGGAGFIGSATSAALIREGHSVVVFDNLSRGLRSSVPDAAEFVLGDVTDTTHLHRVLAENTFDACFHFAALIQVGESMTSPETYFENNTAGSLRLLSALAEHGVRRFVFSSTAAVYGEPNYTPIDEQHPTNPTNAYGESKLATEKMLQWFHHAHGIRSAALRYFNASGAVGKYGERYDGKQSHLIPLALMSATGHRPPLKVFGTDYPTHDGTAVRDYIHMADIAFAHVKALAALEHHTDTAPIVANLGTETGFSVREVLDTVEHVLGVPVPHVNADRRPGDPATLVASAQHAKHALGWTPERSQLETIVTDAWRHYYNTLAT